MESTHFVECTTEPGLFSHERTARVRAADGSKRSLFIDANLIRRVNGKSFLPVSVIKESGSVSTIALPQEAHETESPFMEVSSVVSFE